MSITPGDERKRLLDPVDRSSEILFGLSMAVTIVGSLSIARAGRDEMHAVTIAALGCNIAWGLVDAVMYLVRTVTERTRKRVLAKQIVSADAETAHRLIVQALPDSIAAFTGPDEIEGMRRRLLTARLDTHPILVRRDYLEAFAVFLLVVIATFPVVAPFMVTSDPALAMELSRAISLTMLFLAGFALARYAGIARPVWIGIIMAVLGAVLIVAVMALGG